MRCALVTVWWVFCAVSVVAAQDAAVATASAVADKIGQTVEFQDEVKAVSYSRSTKGYYVSFGAPYPKQTLSVWIDAKIYDHLPMHHSMVGRTVRITGELENSPTGPLLKLASAERFRVMPTDESILSREKLDGKQDRAQFTTAVWQVFEREDFNTLETLAEELRQSKERLYDGSWLSEAFLDAFRLGAKVSGDRYAQVEQRLGRWEQAKPLFHLSISVARYLCPKSKRIEESFA